MRCLCWHQCGLSVLDFTQEGFHNTSSGGFENVGDNEAKKGLKIEEQHHSNRSGHKWSSLGTLERKGQRQKK